MRRRWAKTFAAGSPDRVAFHDNERTGDGRSVYRAHESLSYGACGGGLVLHLFSLPDARLRASGIHEKKVLADASLRPGWGIYSTVPGDAGRVPRRQ